ncbi:MAG: hypothetical protein D6730_11790 [Bacteroidetes bacterium]|nr:MAG: hypothetical protein D6730_11790 [Bacteroidota bacterium]
MFVGNTYMKTWIFLLAVILMACSGGEVSTCKEFFPDGTLSMEVLCDQNGTYQGEMRMYHENGNLKAIRHFADGKEQDTARYFYQFSDQLMRLIPITQDLPNGRLQWFRQDGSLQKEADYLLGELHGEEIFYYPDGKQIAEKYSYQNGQMYGPYVQYRENGLPIKEGFYFNRLRFDQWKFYDDKGEISHVMGYYYNKREGPFAIYRPSGLPYITGSFHENLLSGKINFYDREGSIIFQEEWVDGKKVQGNTGSKTPQSFGPEDVSFKMEGKTFRLEKDQVLVQ